MPTYLPDDDSGTEYTLLPDLVVMDVGYTYTGLRDSRGHKILRRVSRPVGFVHHNQEREYVVQPLDDNEEPEKGHVYEGEGLE